MSNAMCWLNGELMPATEARVPVLDHVLLYGDVSFDFPGHPLRIQTGDDAIKTGKHEKRQEHDECLKIDSDWVHLRACQECGATLCCDSLPNRHATRHAQVSGHPVIASADPGERWLYCHPDNAFAEY